MRPVVIAVTAVAIAIPSSWHVYRDDGVTLRYPPDWYATTARLTYVTSPRQVIAIASYPLPSDARDADGCSPAGALHRLPPHGALIYGFDYGEIVSPRFPPRPRHFRLARFADFECLGPSYLLHFRAAGRSFQIHVVLGKRASPATRQTILRILDSFHASRL